jgi:hypothetical protein
MLKPDNSTEEGVKAPNVTDQSKPTEVQSNAEVAPETDETIDAPDAGDFTDIISLLNLFDKEIGGKGEIANVPAELMGSIKFLVDKLTFIKDMFADPKFKAIIDDMADQAQDGKTPSLDVAIARNIPLAKLQELADTEDYEGVQQELADELDEMKKKGEEDSMYEANFNEFQKGIKEFCTEKRYDDAEKDALSKFILDIMKIFGDGKLTKNEVAQFDKMRNYDKDTEALQSQLVKQPETKEVLPDMSSVESAISKPRTTPPTTPVNQPGMASLGAYSTPGTDVTAVRGQNRRASGR